MIEISISAICKARRSVIAIILLLFSAKLKWLNFCRFIAVFLVTIILLTVSSCYKNTSQPDRTAVDSVKSCRTISHFMGETCVPENPQKIVSLYTTPLANLLALDIKPIAITPATGVQDKYPPYLAEKVKGMEIVGVNYEPNLERIIQLKPDLIVGWNFHEKIYFISD